MKLTNETMFASSIIIGLTGLLYSYMELHRRVKTIERDVNLILSTHLDYINIKDMHTTSIKNINSTLEAIALSTPFKGVGWQTKFIEAKIARDIANWKTPEEHQEDYEHVKNETKFYDDEASEAGV
jgi:hypothetical protein